MRLSALERAAWRKLGQRAKLPLRAATLNSPLAENPARPRDGAGHKRYALAAMDPRDRDRFIRTGPKLPPPAHGIKAKRAGVTWWGQRWIEALARMAPDYRARLERGRSYARNGRAHDLTVEAGSVSALV